MFSGIAIAIRKVDMVGHAPISDLCFWRSTVGFRVVRSALLVLALVLGCCGVVVGVPAASAARTTFAIIGDYGSATPAADRVAAMVRGWNPEFIITVGDNTYGDPNINVSEWERRIGQNYGEFILGRSDNRYPSQTSATQRFFPSVGNHDVIDPQSDGAEPPPGPPYFTGSIEAIRPGYLDYFHTDPGNSDGRLPSGVHEPRRSYYDFRWGGAHFFALDSESAFVDALSAEQQAQWLQSLATDSDAPWKFVYFHHPPYSSGSHGNQSFMQWPFAAWGMSAVFTGHDHTYERVEEGELTYFVNGLSGQGAYNFRTIIPGSIVRYNEHHGAMRVSYDARSVTFEFVAAIPNVGGGFSPTVIDMFELSRPVPEPSIAQLLLAAAAAFGVSRRSSRSRRRKSKSSTTDDPSPRFFDAARRLPK